MSSDTYWNASPILSGHAGRRDEAPSLRAPDGVATASWGRRALARLVDGGLAAVVLALAGMLMIAVEAVGSEVGMRADSTRSADAVAAVINGLLLVAGVFGPPIAFEIWCIKRWGASPGKRLLGLRVQPLRSEASLTWWVVLARFGVWAALWVVPLGRVLDYLWPLWDHRGQALHDKVGTVVVTTRHVS